jgi:hypothetical protein
VADLGVWVGLAVTLAIFSLLLGDTQIARWAQHLVVGAAMGYAVVLTVHYLLRPRLVDPLLQGEWRSVAAPLALGVLLLLAGGERVIRQSRLPQVGGERSGEREGGGAGGRAGRFWGIVGVAPLAMLLGTALGVALAGIVQGTLLPQTGEVITDTWATGRSGSVFWYGALSLLLTTATLLHLTLDRNRHVEALPRPFRDLMRGWVWIGQRALWIAAGVLLGRLFVSRFSLIFARLQAISDSLQTTGIARWVESLWNQLFG